MQRRVRRARPLSVTSKGERQVVSPAGQRFSVSVRCFAEAALHLTQAAAVDDDIQTHREIASSS